MKLMPAKMKTKYMINRSKAILKEVLPDEFVLSAKLLLMRMISKQCHAYEFIVTLGHLNTVPFDKFIVLRTVDDEIGKQGSCLTIHKIMA